MLRIEPASARAADAAPALEVLERVEERVPADPGHRRPGDPPNVLEVGAQAASAASITIAPSPRLTLRSMRSM